MTSGGIYRSERGEERIKGLYDRMVSSLDTDVDRRWVETRFGETHLLVTGDERSPPLVVFHGGNSVNPLTLEWFLPLADDFRIYAPDTIGHPGYSTQTRLSPRDRSYGKWVDDVLDGLGIDAAPMVGVSYGAGIVLRTAAHSPERITCAGLLNPSGLGTGSIRRMLFEILVPLALYRAFSKESHLESVLQSIYSEPVSGLDETHVDLLRAVFEDVKLERNLPKTASSSELAEYDAPTLVSVSEHDVFFPPDVVVPRARSVIKHLDVVVRLQGESHVPSRDARDELLEHVSEFLLANCRRS